MLTNTVFMGILDLTKTRTLHHGWKGADEHNRMACTSMISVRRLSVLSLDCQGVDFRGNLCAGMGSVES